jgi:hypothetical protein
MSCTVVWKRQKKLGSGSPLYKMAIADLPHRAFWHLDHPTLVLIFYQSAVVISPAPRGRSFVAVWLHVSTIVSNNQSSVHFAYCCRHHAGTSHVPTSSRNKALTPSPHRQPQPPHSRRRAISPPPSHPDPALLPSRAHSEEMPWQSSRIYLFILRRSAAATLGSQSQRPPAPRPADVSPKQKVLEAWRG